MMDWVFNFYGWIIVIDGLYTDFKIKILASQREEIALECPPII